MRSKLTFQAIVLLAFNLPLFAQNNTYTGTNAGNGTNNGIENVAVGYNAGDVLAVNGNYNSFFGANSGKLVTTGDGNSFLGQLSGNSLQTGNYNTFLGFMAGYLSTNSLNVYVGAYSGAASTSATQNTYLGYFSGRNNVSGTGNVFIGYGAGADETGSGKLYIANSTTPTPLIYGDFNLGRVGIAVAPSTYTLNVGGTFNATSLFLNGSQALQSSGGNVSFPVGNVSIGTSNAQGYKLAVAGKIVAEELVIKLQTNWPDYVFDNSYDLLSLDELGKYIAKHKHLPHVPSAREVKENGLTVGEMNTVLIEKIEELTLYILELKGEVEALKKKTN